MAQKPEYPLYEMYLNGKLCWCTLEEAGILYNSNYDDVSIGTLMIDSQTALPRSVPDRRAFELQLREIADKISSGK